MNCICKKGNKRLTYKNQHVCDLKDESLLKAAIAGIKDAIMWRDRFFDKDRDLMNEVFKRK